VLVAVTWDKILEFSRWIAWKWLIKGIIANHEIIAREARSNLVPESYKLILKPVLIRHNERVERLKTLHGHVVLTEWHGDAVFNQWVSIVIVSETVRSQISADAKVLQYWSQDRVQPSIEADWILTNGTLSVEVWDALATD